MNESTSFHGVESRKDREKNRAFIAVAWLGPVIAWLAVLAISVAAVSVLLSEQ